jgi:hypothetical protein
MMADNPLSLFALSVRRVIDVGLRYADSEANSYAEHVARGSFLNEKLSMWNLINPARATLDERDPVVATRWAVMSDALMNLQMLQGTYPIDKKKAQETMEQLSRALEGLIPHSQQQSIPDSPRNQSSPRRDEGDTAAVLEAALDQLITDKDFTVGSKAEVIERAEVCRSTGYKVFNKTPKILAKWRTYQGLRSGGRGPQRRKKSTR